VKTIIRQKYLFLLNWGIFYRTNFSYL